MQLARRSLSDRVGLTYLITQDVVLAIGVTGKAVFLHAKVKEVYVVRRSGLDINGI